MALGARARGCLVRGSERRVRIVHAPRGSGAGPAGDVIAPRAAYASNAYVDDDRPDGSRGRVPPASSAAPGLSAGRKKALSDASASRPRGPVYLYGASATSVRRRRTPADTYERLPNTIRASV
ncbi:hypothetical protein EVAR_92134_1 [Eumeta japonica]|uniref:Uncharacterized protein n=1 Tax=Eumeta variegata TaxID=151549 RepID=A0A4C1SZ63_EUMVA|nr:hypothetical protein EVAR_92134_1 [Eumeta japonica]